MTKNKELPSVNYLLNGKLINFKLGQTVYPLERKQVNDYKKCESCGHDFSIMGRHKYIYPINEVEIFGFEIKGNSMFGYNLNNEFKLRIEVIDEQGNTDWYDVNNLFLTKEELEVEIERRKEYDR